MEQRYQGALAVVQDGWKVTEVARRLGVSRQSVHSWIARYEAGPEGLEILVIGAPNLGDDPRGDVDGRRDWWAHA